MFLVAVVQFAVFALTHDLRYAILSHGIRQAETLDTSYLYRRSGKLDVSKSQTFLVLYTTMCI